MRAACDTSRRRRATARRLAALAAALGLGALAACSPSAAPRASRPTTPRAPGTSPSPTSPAQPSPPPGNGSCPPATTTVSTPDQLSTALSDAKPGDSIRLSPGTYRGTFTARAPATRTAPIFLCGDASAVLSGDGVESGYVLHLDGASFWRVVGFTVRNGQKGVMVDATSDARIEGLHVEHIGDEAIHLRRDSSRNVVAHNTVRDTGLRRAKFGEGIYVGTAESNWCKVSGCRPDHSDHNDLVGNDIAATTAENIDVKEGTTGGRIIDNVFDGRGMEEADSWVDVKGNGWLIQGNRGRSAPQDGFQTHQIVDGWGTGNVFRDNTAAVDGPGYGFAFHPELGNRLLCDNTVTGAAEGLSNLACTPAQK
jgi:hypothetical protein